MRIDFITNNQRKGDKSEDLVPAYIPASYIEEATLRIVAYRQLAELTTLKELKTLLGEWVDRFGKPPVPVENLLACTELKIIAAHSGISVIEIKDKKFMLTKGGNYIMVDGKFPRLKGRRNKQRLRAAVDMLRTLI